MIMADITICIFGIDVVIYYEKSWQNVLKKMDKSGYRKLIHMSSQIVHTDR